jgi:hypothetical protein
VAEHPTAVEMTRSESMYNCTKYTSLMLYMISWVRPDDSQRRDKFTKAGQIPAASEIDIQNTVINGPFHHTTAKKQPQTTAPAPVP